MKGPVRQIITLKDGTVLHCSGSTVGVYVYLDEARTEWALELVYDMPKTEDEKGRWRILDDYARDPETRELLRGSPLFNRFATPQLSEIFEAVKETYGNYGRPMAHL